MLDTLLTQGYKPVTVGKCFGNPETNWHRNSSGSIFISGSPTLSFTENSESPASRTMYAPLLSFQLMEAVRSLLVYHA